MVKTNKKKFNQQVDFKIKKTSKPKGILKKTLGDKKIRKIMENIDSSNIKPPKIPIDSTEIKPGNIGNALDGILKFHSENPKIKNQLFDEQFPIFLQISCYRVPKGYSKIYRIPLKYSLYNNESEVCLIVSEVKGIKNSEYDQHKEHYEKLLSDKGILNIKHIKTFHEFRSEYETFEQKSRLVDLYDVFLADSKISGKVVKKCGKIFYNKRKVPSSVKLQMTKLKEHIDKTLSKTFLHMHLKGNCFTVQVGHNKMTTKELQENFQSIKEFLDRDFPGGFNNIMGLQIFAPRVPSIPVYFSTKSGKDIEVPKIALKKPKAFKTYRGELTTLPNANVIVKPSGTVIVKRIASEEDEISNKELTKPEYPKKIKRKAKEGTKYVKKSEPINEIGEERKLKKSKRKINQVSEETEPKQNKRKKRILKIESGKIEDEVVSGELTLGDQIITQKNKTEVVENLKFNQTKQIFKSASSLIKSKKSKVTEKRGKKEVKM